MRASAPASDIERLFAQYAARSLPIGEAEIGRTEHGVLNYYWPSPCEELGGLRAYIREGEIMLSTNIAHEHVDRDVPKRIVEAAVARILAILESDIVFVRAYDTAGKQTRYGSSPRHLWVDQQLREHRTTERAWDWMGEVRVH